MSMMRLALPWSILGACACQAGPVQQPADLWLLDRDGRPIRALTDYEGPDEEPEFSPDGRLILFDSFRAGSNGPMVRSGGDSPMIRRGTVGPTGPRMEIGSCSHRSERGIARSS